jgi:GntR family transcriptional regulator
MLKDKAIPLYYQIETILRRKILSGELQPLTPIPTEDALAQEFDVSRITIRQALGLLEKDGLVIRQRGKGTFVSEGVKAYESAKLTGSMEDLILMGVQTSTKILDFSWSEAPQSVKERLGLGADSQVLRIEKIRIVDEKPFSYVVNYLPKKIGEKIHAQDVTAKPTLMVLEENLDIRPDQAEQTIEATIADAHVAPLLDIRVGDPLLKVERTVFDVKNRPVECVFVLYRADKYFFNVKLKRTRSKNSIGWRAV